VSLILVALVGMCEGHCSEEEEKNGRSRPPCHYEDIVVNPGAGALTESFQE